VTAGSPDTGEVAARAPAAVDIRQPLLAAAMPSAYNTACGVRYAAPGSTLRTTVLLFAAGVIALIVTGPAP
jgi:hypothetical protein